MEKARRDFLRTISGVAALPAIGSALAAEPRTGPVRQVQTTCVHSSRCSGIPTELRPRKLTKNDFLLLPQPRSVLHCLARPST
jgi:hypothetical protein